MPEIFRTSLPMDRPHEELRLTLFSSQEAQWVSLEVFSLGSSSLPDDQGPQVPVPRSSVSGPRSITLPLSLWPRFHAAVCCLGAFMKPLPAPAYQATSCCNCLCPPTPEPVVLIKNPQEQLHLTLQNRRGSTFLEIKALKPFTSGDSGENGTIRLGPTLWSGFFAAIHKLHRIIADL
jgi:hypothetical protein